MGVPAASGMQNLLSSGHSEADPIISPSPGSHSLFFWLPHHEEQEMMTTLEQGDAVSGEATGLGVGHLGSASSCATD